MKEYTKTLESQPPGCVPSSAQQGGAQPGEEQSDSPSSLYSNNSTEDTLDHQTECVQACVSLLTPYRKKQAESLYQNVKRLVESAPSSSYIGFLTLTFADNVTCPKEAYKRFRSFNSHFLSKHPKIKDWIKVTERQVRGAIHYHLIVVLTVEIKTGFDFDYFKKWSKRRRKKGSCPKCCNENLKQLWKDFAGKLENYKLGWVFSLEPVKSNTEAISRYMGKYVSKHLGNRTDQDKGARLINYSRGWTKNSCKFSWLTPKAQLWRRKLRMFANHHGCTEFYQLHAKLGTGWAYRYADDIMNIFETIAESAPQPEYQDPTVRRAVDRKTSREAQKQAQKQKAKDDGRFREWEKEQVYSSRKKETRKETSRAVEKAKDAWLLTPEIQAWTDTIEEAKKLNRKGNPVPF